MKRFLRCMLALVLVLATILTGPTSGMRIAEASNPMSSLEQQIWDQINANEYVDCPMPDEDFNGIRILPDSEYLGENSSIKLSLVRYDGSHINEGVNWYYQSPYGYEGNTSDTNVYSAGQVASGSILSLASDGTVAAIAFTTSAKNTYAPLIYATHEGVLYKFQIDLIMKSDAEILADTDRNEKQDAVNAEIARIISDLGINSMTSKIQKVQAVHDYMAKNIFYHKGSEQGKSVYLLYQTLIEKKAVCEGYAYAFKKIMDTIGIDCELLEGPIDNSAQYNWYSRHAWNAVKLDDNKWYYLDVTWDSNRYMGHADNPVNPHRPQFLYDYYLLSPEEFTKSHKTTLPSGYELGTTYIRQKTDPTTVNTIYTSFANTNDNTGDGTSQSPYNLLSTAIERASDGDTIVVKGAGYSNDFGNSAPLVIDKSLIIRGEGSFPVVTIRNGGIILGSNVTMENITLSLPNTDRNAIMANGYSLRLDGVKYQSNAQSVNLFCGGLAGYAQGGLPVRGSHGQIVIDNGYTLGDKSNIYAGNLVESIGASDSAFSGDATVIISGMNSNNRLGNFYAYGAIKQTPLGIDLGGTKIEAPEAGSSIGVTGNVNVTINSTSISCVYGDRGGSKYTNVTFIDTSSLSGLVNTVILDGIGDLNVKSGYIIPAASSSFAKSNPDITIASSARLGLNNFGNTLSVGNFNSMGGLVLGASSLLTITGNVVGKSRVAVGSMSPTSMNYRSEGDFTIDHTYIKAINSTDTSFVINPRSGNDVVFERASSGDWTAKSRAGGSPTPDITKITNFNISDRSYDKGTKINMFTIPISVTYSYDTNVRDMGGLELSMKYNNKALSGPDSAGGYRYGSGSSALELCIVNDTLYVNRADYSNFPAGVYSFSVTVKAADATNNSAITKSFKVTIPADDSGNGNTGDGGGSTPPPYNPPAPGPGDTPAGDSNIEVLVSSGNATVTNITTENLNKLAQAQSASSTTLVIDAKSGSSSKVSQITIPKTEAKVVSDYLGSSSNNKKAIEVAMTDSVIRVDATAFKSIYDQSYGSNIKIYVGSKPNSSLSSAQKDMLKDVEHVSTFEAYITSGTERITSFGGGKITVGKIDFVREAGKALDKYKVVYLSDSGSMETMKSWFEGGHIYFETNHLSTYAIAYDDKAQTTKTTVARLRNPISGDHFYTTGPEAALAKAAGYIMEADAYFTTTGTVDVYSLYNPINGDHFYTASYDEAKAAQTYAMYIIEGVRFKANAKNVGIPVYRCLNIYSGEHFYTTSEAEANAARASGYVREGVAFYAD